MVYLSSNDSPRHRMKVTRCRAPSLMIHEAARIAAAEWKSGRARSISGLDLRRLQYLGQFDLRTGQIDLSGQMILLVNSDSYLLNSGLYPTVESLEKSLMTVALLKDLHVSWAIPSRFENDRERDLFLAGLVRW